MNTTTHYQPWALLNELQGNLNRYLEQQRQLNNGDHSNVVTSEWLPAVDIKEEADHFVLFADLPGIEPKDIDITMDNGTLTIKGERTLEGRDNGKNGKEYSRVERAHGRFYRRFSLPDTANPDAIQAKGEHGVLTITIPKQEKIQPRRIEVTH